MCPDVHSQVPTLWVLDSLSHSRLVPSRPQTPDTWNPTRNLEMQPSFLPKLLVRALRMNSYRSSFKIDPLPAFTLLDEAFIVEL